MAIPTFYVESVLHIHPHRLREHGKRLIILDLDNTILPRDRDFIHDELLAWVRSIQEGGIQVCLVSNSWFGRVSTVAEQIGVPFVDKAIKPLPPAFLLGLFKCRTWPWHAAVVGDQFFTDVLGGTFLGMMTIMVLPLAKHDLKHTLMLRHVEKLFMRDRKPLTSI
jgi:HAD superfamily phosphatase (TIGR01668 family)